MTNPEPEASSDVVTDHPSSGKGVVVLLHGLGMGNWIMALLAQRLRRAGYRVENWGYYSVGQSLETLIPHFTRKFETLQSNLPDGTRLSIVAHSMGSIITRATLTKINLPSLKRIVMLSPPNHGSHVATILGPYLRWLTRLVDELSDRQDSLVNCLPESLPDSLQVGIIAAEWDYVLNELSTHLDCEVDHITVPSRHTGLVLRLAVAQQILFFLDHGRFQRDTPPAPPGEEEPSAITDSTSPDSLHG